MITCNCPERYYTHVCRSSDKIDEYSTFAHILFKSEQDNEMVIERVQEFGELKLGIVKITFQEFKKYFEITDEEAKKCLRNQK